MRGKSLTLSVPFLLFYFLKSVGVCAVLLPPPWICLGFSSSWGVVGRYIVQCTPVLTLLTAQGMALDPNLQLNHKITGFEGKSPIAECGQSSLYQNLLSFFLVGETPLPVRTSFFFQPVWVKVALNPPIFMLSFISRANPGAVRGRDKNLAVPAGMCLEHLPSLFVSYCWWWLTRYLTWHQ